MPNGNITSATTNLPFVLPNRKGFSYKPNLENVQAAYTLESVRERLSRQAKYEHAQVRDVDLNTLSLTMVNDTLCLRRKIGIKDGSVKYSAPTPLHYDAWRQLYGFVMTPTTATQGTRPLLEFMLRDANHMDTVPKQMGLGVVNYLLSNCGNKPVSIHVKNRRFGEDDIRIISAIVSQNYVRMSHVDYVGSLLTVPEFRDRKVVDFRTDDRRLYLRMLIDPVSNDIEVRRQYRTFDGWNGESGHRSYGGCDGVFRWECLNGMGNHSVQERFSWPHVGSQSPGERVRNALGVIMERSTRTQQAYDSALASELSDGFAFMEDIMTGEKYGEQAISGVRKAMLDDTSSKYGCLANVIDGMTLYAQEYATIEDREKLERVAHKVLVRR